MISKELIGESYMRQKFNQSTQIIYWEHAVWPSSGYDRVKNIRHGLFLQEVHNVKRAICALSKRKENTMQSIIFSDA